MDDKMEGDWAVGRAIRMSLVLAFLFLFASGANAYVIDVSPGDSITDAIASASFGDTVLVHPGTYVEDVQVDQGVILRGLDNPTLDNASPGADTINVTGLGEFAVITGFNITGNHAGTGVYINGSDGAYNVSLVYNNIYRNGVGLNASDFGSCPDNEPYTLDFWGENGTGPFKGMPGAASESTIGKANVKANSKVNSKVNTKVNAKVNSKAYVKAIGGVNSVVHRNNRIVGRADASSWLTGRTINGNAINTVYTGACDDLFLFNPEAGVDVSIAGAIGDSCVVGSAAYLETPYGPIPSGLGVAIRYIDVVVMGDNVDQARVDISYTPEEVADAGVFEDTLTPYLWTGTTWRSPIEGTLIRDPDNGVVSGNFSTLSLSGQPIALIGRSYKVTILPPQNPSTAISTKPVLNITIDSAASIGSVYYQLDGHASNGWRLIEDVGSYYWRNSSWTISDADWTNVTNGTHTFYFNFTRDSLPAVGGNGEISWRFTKGGNTPPVSPIVVTSPKAGDTLTRAPWKITWTMPTPENVLSVDLWFARDGDFTMRGGLNNPLHLATLGGDTSYLWTSPNFQTDTSKIAAVVMYNDGTQYVGFSDDFSLAKGYSFHAIKPIPKTPWQLGSGVSHAVAVLGSWFKKPHIPYVIG